LTTLGTLSARTPLGVKLYELGHRSQLFLLYDQLGRLTGIHNHSPPSLPALSENGIQSY
jgi:hypothetical protein